MTAKHARSYSSGPRSVVAQSMSASCAPSPPRRKRGAWVGVDDRDRQLVVRDGADDRWPDAARRGGHVFWGWRWYPGTGRPIPRASDSGGRNRPGSRAALGVPGPAPVRRAWPDQEPTGPGEAPGSCRSSASVPSGRRIVSSLSPVRAGAPQASPRAARNSAIRKPLTSPAASASSTSLATYRPSAVRTSQVAEFHPLERRDRLDAVRPGAERRLDVLAGYPAAAAHHCRALPRPCRAAAPSSAATRHGFRSPCGPICPLFFTRNPCYVPADLAPPPANLSRRYSTILLACS